VFRIPFSVLLVGRPSAEDHDEALERLDAALATVRSAPSSADPELASPDERAAAEEVIGRLLLAVVDVARIARVDPELSLRQVADGLREVADGAG